MTGISIVIPTLHRTQFLKDTLDDLFLQEFEYPYEIIIVDQSEKADELIKNQVIPFANVRYFHIIEFRGLPEARNFGWQNAKYDYILYVDDDIKCNSNLLAEHYKLISKPEIGIVAGGITEANKDNIDCNIGKFIKYSATPLRGFHQKGKKEVDHAGGGNFSAKKEILRKVYGIDENLTKGAALYEETDLCLRVKKAGYTIFFNSDAHVFHLAAATGGCRVQEIDRYLYSLVRNRSLIITRHLNFIHKITAHLYLIKLILAYVVSYKQLHLFDVYIAARNEGAIAGKQSVKCSNYEG